MYGGPVDIPAFEFLEKADGVYRWFPRPWDAAAVEARHAARAPGVLRGGRTYGCVFGGGADDTVATFARLLRPEPSRLRGRVRAWLVPLLLVVPVVLRLLAWTAWELVRWSGRALRDLALARGIESLHDLGARLLIGGWMRELFTLGVTLDVYAGVPVLYVNFVDYDVSGHALGPQHPAAFRALRGVDRSIGAIARAVRRVPELDYDLFVLSDHGQVLSVPFAAASPGQSVASMVLECFGPPRGETPAVARPAPAVTVDPPMPLWPFAAARQRGLEFLDRPLRERNAVWAGGLCVVPAGPNVNVYLTHTPGRVRTEEIEARYPGALARLSRHRAIGLVLARDAGGPVCYYHGEVFRIPPTPGVTGCPVFDRPDRHIVVRGLQDLLDMPSGGDVILYGHYADAGCVNYLGERGGHAGPSEAELYAFVAGPPALAATLAAVTAPSDLHAVLESYHQTTGGEPRRAAPSPPGGRACRARPEERSRG
jgi:hypothetical protein